MSASDRLLGRTGAAPVIGLTTYVERAQQGVWDVPAAYLQYQYVESVTRVGGIALLLPPQPVGEGPEGVGGAVGAVLDRLDGLVLTGGKDVDARLYGAAPHPEADAPRAERDTWEMRLARAALDRDLPLLGICRGAQVLNVALGGTLVQHLPEVTGTDAHRAGPGRFAHHDVRTVPGSLLADLLGPTVGAACYHHQALAELAPSLVAAGHAEDDVVEAVEVVGARFALAVQWHPEELRDDVRLFQALVDAASGVPAGAGRAGKESR